MEKNPRHIGLLQQVYKFCDKYRLSCEVPDVKLILHNGLRTMALENKMLSISEPDKNNHYVNVTVYCMDEFMANGPFTPEQLKDLSELGAVIKFES